jgi:Holliday junction resolvasome RuvABC endonuclease subunit
MHILVLDPAMANTGYLIVKLENGKETLEECGVIQTKLDKRDYIAFDNVRRFQKIYRKLKELHEEYGYKAVLAEIPTGSQSAKAATGFGGVAGVLGCLVIDLSLVNIWKLPQQVKKCLCGSGKASKGDMVRAAADIFPSSIEQFITKRGKFRIHDKRVKGSYEHVADAVGVFKTCRKTNDYNMIRMLSEQG